jgi:osmotically-inducible protein OsmY
MPSIRVESLLLSALLAAGAVPLLGGCAPAAVVGTAYGASVIHDRRPAQVVLDDEVIELQAKHLYLQARELSDHSRIAVTSYNHIALLTGQADTAAVARGFAEEVSRLPKVRRVHNEVQVGPRISLARESTDALITSRAKIAIGGGRGIEDFDATRIKVVTEDGVVYLMGLVTQQEGDVTAEVVRRLPGVKRVVKIFEYVEPRPTTAARPATRQRPA